MGSTSELADLERELEQLKQQLPRHSISPSIQARMDELEEEIAALGARPPVSDAECDGHVSTDAGG